MSRGPAPPDKPAGRPTVPEGAELVRAVYAREGGGAGCCLHILTDDGNVSESDAAWVLEYAQEHGHQDCIAAARALAAMTVSQRRRAIARAHATQPLPGR